MDFFICFHVKTMSATESSRSLVQFTYVMKLNLSNVQIDSQDWSFCVCIATMDMELAITDESFAVHWKTWLFTLSRTSPRGHVHEWSAGDVCPNIFPIKFHAVAAKIMLASDIIRGLIMRTWWSFACESTHASLRSSSINAEELRVLWDKLQSTFW